MRTDVFFDSNVLLYLADDDAKAARTEQLLSEGGVVDPLVLAETAHVLIRRWKWNWQDANELLDVFLANTRVSPLGEEAFLRGLRYSERYRLQPFDAIIVASAVLSGCTILYSEDMHNELVIDGLTVRNPYR